MTPTLLQYSLNDIRMAFQQAANQSVAVPSVAEAIEQLGNRIVDSLQQTANSEHSGQLIFGSHPELKAAAMVLTGNLTADPVFFFANYFVPNGLDAGAYRAASEQLHGNDPHLKRFNEVVNELFKRLVGESSRDDLKTTVITIDYDHLDFKIRPHLPALKVIERAELRFSLSDNSDPHPEVTISKVAVYSDPELDDLVLANVRYTCTKPDILMNGTSQWSSGYCTYQSVVHSKEHPFGFSFPTCFINSFVAKELLTKLFAEIGDISSDEWTESISEADILVMCRDLLKKVLDNLGLDVETNSPPLPPIKIRFSNQGDVLITSEWLSDKDIEVEPIPRFNGMPYSAQRSYLDNTILPELEARITDHYRSLVENKDD